MKGNDYMLEKQRKVINSNFSNTEILNDYSCDNVECLEEVNKTKRLERTFETKISEEIYENLRGVIIDK